MESLREDKPRWSSVPESVRRRAAELLGSEVVRTRRAFGGYGPSATFLLTLADGSRAFFKGVYPLPAGSAVSWSLDVEEKVYAQLGDLIHPWAPAYHGSLNADGWHALLLEAIDGVKVPPWTSSSAAISARSYARFHSATQGRPMPAWLPRDSHVEFAGHWRQIAADDEARSRLTSLAGSDSNAAGVWLAENLDALTAAEAGLATAPPPYALLHSDTRSDNIRLQGELLRMFDWPFAFVGPPEFDLAAFAQSIESEDGPPAEAVVDWYASVLPIRHEVLLSAAVGVAGYFADRAPRPTMPGLPRLRTVQRSQLKASLAWAARMLGLPEPRWLLSDPS